MVSTTIAAVKSTEEITRLHSEIVDSLQSNLEKAIRVGELLAEQKSAMPHGTFAVWVTDNLPFSTRTARRYMRLHRERGRLKTDTVSDLSGAYRLLTEERAPETWAPLPAPGQRTVGRCDAQTHAVVVTPHTQDGYYLVSVYDLDEGVEHYTQRGINGDHVDITAAAYLVIAGGPDVSDWRVEDDE